MLDDDQVARIGKGAKRRQYARWVGEAKRAETRQRRVAESVNRLRDGRSRG